MKTNDNAGIYIAQLHYKYRLNDGEITTITPFDYYACETLLRLGYARRISNDKYELFKTTNILSVFADVIQDYEMEERRRQKSSKYHERFLEQKQWEDGEEVRLYILRENNYKCAYCGEQIVYRKDYHVDHVFPLCNGGSDNIRNKIASCAKCNTKKGGRTPIEAEMLFSHNPRNVSLCGIKSY